MGGRLEEFVDEWVGIIQDPYVLVTVQGTCYNSVTNPYWWRLLTGKDSGGHNGLGDQLNALWWYYRGWPREQVVLHIPIYDSWIEWRKLLHYKSEVAKPIHNLYKVQNDHPEAHQWGHSSRTMGSLTQHQVSILPHSSGKDASLLPYFLSCKWRGGISQFKILSFSLSTAPKTFTRVMKPILLQCWKMGITLFLSLDDGLILDDSYSQARKDEQREHSCYEN